MFKKFMYIFLCSTLLCSSSSVAQFYNGLQTTFGKNRVQYKESFWRYLRYNDFDVYYDRAGRGLAEFVAKNAVVIQQDVLAMLEMQYSRRVVFVVYNTLNDFKQSNIGLNTSEEQYNIGGTTQIIDNKVVLYYNGDYNELKRQIKQGITTLIILEFLYGNENYRQILSNSALSEYPAWFVNGITDFVAGNWNPLMEEKLYEGLQTKKFQKIVHLEGEDAVIAGHALWKYISEVYGNDVVANILYLCKVTESVDAGFSFILQKNVKQLCEEMEEYYVKRHELLGTAEISGTKLSLRTRTKKHPISHISISPVNNDVVFVNNVRGKAYVWLYDSEKNTRKKIFSLGNKLNQITDYSYPIAEWHPTGKAFSFFYEHKATLWFAIYVVESKELLVREFHHFEKVLEYSYAPNGNTIVFSGVKDGKTDIYSYNILTYTTTRYTNDIADDRFPRYVDYGSSIVFSSNRLVASPRHTIDSIRQSFDLFQMSSNHREKSIKPITNTIHDNEIKPIEAARGKYVFLTDNNGLYNLHVTMPDSVISHIDTVVHYRHFTHTYPLTHSRKNIIDFSLQSSTGTILTYAKQKGKNVLQLSSYAQLEQNRPQDVSRTMFKTILDSLRIEQAEQNEGLQKVSYAELKKEMPINYLLYLFEYEVQPYNAVVDSVFASDTLGKQYRLSYVYQTNFYINQVVNQVDFGFTNSSYQAFTGNAFYFMPGANFFFKFGAIDLFEDYRVTGGVRFTGSLHTNEYIVSVENVKKRWDKQLLLHKQTLMTYAMTGTLGYTYEFHKMHDYNALFYLKYPFSQVSAFVLNPSIRYNKDIVLSTDLNTLQKPAMHHVWTGISCKYIYDNTNPISLNILEGTRMKFFVEAFGDVSKKNTFLSVGGFDARNYVKIHRNIIFASRVAYSFSFGNAPLLYYLGSLDKWINIVGRYTTFNSTIEYDKTTPWAYQSLATNLRGFNQNIRNGPSFAVYNGELRFPIVQYIVNRPIASDVLANFQLVGFFDIGAAWAGLYPGDKSNAYNISIIQNNPITVEIDEMRSPAVYGYGFGLRSRVFGYFMRADWAWGVDDGTTQTIFYLSVSLDF